MKKQLLPVFLFSLLGAASLQAQNTTIGQKNTDTREAATTHKAMIIPFEPRMYMGEVDMSIHNETKLSAKEIKYKFRDGLNEQLFKAFKASGYGVLDLMEDTAKYKKDVDGIYQYLSYDFQKVPDQEKYEAPKKEKEDKKIQKGQLTVETGDQSARFMNAKITNPKLVPLLYGKYKTDLFVFINQLDIKSSTSNDPTQLANGNGNRKIVVHYTVYSLDAKEINSGIAEEEFEATLNNPKKIIDRYFSKIATTIVQRVNKQMSAPAPAKH